MKKLLLVFLLLLLSPVCYGQDVDGVSRQSEQVLNDIWNDSTNSIRVTLSSEASTSDPKNALIVVVSADSSVITGQKVNGTPGTVLALSADSSVITSVIISVLPTNANLVFIGLSATLTATHGFIMTGDDSIVLGVDNIQDIFIDAEKAGDGVSWIATIR